ncbi:MotA/TolQ/ExbB proton channel family protein [Aquimarina algiphila]|uniref:MotA/TolQ/ExbB proton channel family protein n=1 Tax=Aquimarina algiphila TaxID=2047982 RepID=UPI00232D5601|nr:MotA/TolQ/ExbB proton channel family protein [Aquimarina algiphila]
MISLLFILQQKESFFSALFSRINEGGPFFMVPILIMLLLTFFLIIKSVIALKQGSATLQKNISLLSSIGLLTLVWGMLGQLIGLVEMFDHVEKIGDLSTGIFAGGLKVSALPPIFGFFVFIISRAAIIVFTWIGKEAGQK